MLGTITSAKGHHFHVCPVSLRIRSLAIAVTAALGAIYANPVGAATYSYDSGGATIATNVGSWADGPNWDADAPAGGPAGADSIVQTLTTGGHTAVNLGGARTVTDFQWSSSTVFEVRAQTGPSSLTVTGTLTKDTNTSALIFREAASQALTLSINNLVVNAGTISFSNPVAAGTLTVSGTTTINGANSSITNNYSPNTPSYGPIVIGSTGGRFFVGSTGTALRTVDAASLESTATTTAIVTTNLTSGTALNGVLNLTGTSGSTTYAGRLVNNAGSNGSSSFTVNKTGGSTQVLTGTTSTFSGGLTVSGGTLLANNASGTATGSATNVITVNNNGRLGGTGIVISPTTINTGGKLLGGDGVLASDDLTLAGDVTLGDGSIVELVVGPAGAHSSLARTGGTWTFDNDQAFSLLNIATGTYDNIITGLAGDPLTTATWTLTDPNYSGAFTFDGVNIDLVVSAVAVPEPGVVGLLAGATLMLGVRRHRVR